MSGPYVPHVVVVRVMPVLQYDLVKHGSVALMWLVYGTADQTMAVAKSDIGRIVLVRGPGESI